MSDEDVKPAPIQTWTAWQQEGGPHAERVILRVQRHDDGGPGPCRLLALEFREDWKGWVGELRVRRESDNKIGIHCDGEMRAGRIDIPRPATFDPHPGHIITFRARRKHWWAFWRWSMKPGMVVLHWEPL